MAFIADSSSFFASALAVGFIAVPRTTTQTGGKPGSIRSVWVDLREGMAYLFGNRTALGVLVCMTMASVGFSTVNMIWIPYLQRIFGIGANGLGIADAAMGLGMLISGLLVGQIARQINKTVMSAGSLVFIGLMYMGIIFLPAFGWIIGWQFLCGLSLTPLQAALDTIVQMAVPDLKRGRVTSVMNAAYNAAGLLSMSGAALFGEAIGLEAVFLVVGFFVLLSGLIGFRLLREPERPLGFEKSASR